jgi:hypothetical protein
MMLYRLNPDGSVDAPMRAEGPGGIVGDGTKTIRPGDEGYVEALEQARIDEAFARASSE